MINQELFILFVALQIANVIMQTIKSLVTQKCGKEAASIVNAMAYGLYQVILVYAVCELPLWLKVSVVALANLIGVYIVKWGEEKVRKDKLWKIEATVPKIYFDKIHKTLEDVPHSYIDLEKYVLFNFYCVNQEESLKVKNIVNKYKAKYFVSESKTL